MFTCEVSSAAFPWRSVYHVIKGSEKPRGASRRLERVDLKRLHTNIPFNNGGNDGVSPARDGGAAAAAVWGGRVRETRAPHPR